MHAMSFYRGSRPACPSIPFPGRRPAHAVVPRESSHFGFYNGSQLLGMEQTELYQQDWIGLRQLQVGRDTLPAAAAAAATAAVGKWRTGSTHGSTSWL